MFSEIVSILSLVPNEMYVLHIHIMYIHNPSASILSFACVAYLLALGVEALWFLSRFMQYNWL
jgi:exosome complex RNA-binding protein Rrp42 (RNase PH superfamily)